MWVSSFSITSALYSFSFYLLLFSTSLTPARGCMLPPQHLVQALAHCRGRIQICGEDGFACSVLAFLCPASPSKWMWQSRPSDCEAPLGTWLFTLVHISSPGCLSTEGLSPPKCLHQPQRVKIKSTGIGSARVEISTTSLTKWVTLVKSLHNQFL